MQNQESLAPAVVLVRPQLGMNIGMVARAMANFALDDLRLLAPRDGWPNPDAGPTAAGADHILAGARLADRMGDALAGCRITFATSARPRHSRKPVLTPREAAEKMREAVAQGLKPGILFGPERSGLTADDLAATDFIVTCPVNPDFSSLNLAQAVVLMSYEWYVAGEAPAAPHEADPPAPFNEMDSFLTHLDDSLEKSGYFDVPGRTASTKRSLAGLIAHARFTSDDLRMLHGVIRSLVGRQPD